MRSISFVPSALLFLTACTGLLASCAGGPGSDGSGTDSGNVPDGICNGSYSDPDCEEEQFSATVTLSFPDAETTDVTGFTVDGDEPKEDEGTCDLEARTCTFITDREDDYDFQLVGSTWLYRPKPVSVTENGQSSSLLWTLEGSGCADESWDPLGEIPCEDWTPGDYGRIVDGVCQESGDDDDEVKASTHVEEISGEDLVTIWLDFCNPTGTMAGNSFSGSCEDGSQIHGEISETGDVLYHWMREGEKTREISVDCPQLG